MNESCHLVYGRAPGIVTADAHHAVVQVHVHAPCLRLQLEVVLRRRQCLQAVPVAATWKCVLVHQPNLRSKGRALQSLVAQIQAACSWCIGAQSALGSKRSRMQTDGDMHTDLPSLSVQLHARLELGETKWSVADLETFIWRVSPTAAATRLASRLTGSASQSTSARPLHSPAAGAQRRLTKRDTPLALHDEDVDVPVVHA